MLGSGPASGHSTAPAYVGDGRIEPSRMDGRDLQPTLVANTADTLLASSKAVRSRGEAVHTAWAGLGTPYQEAPEREQLLAVMDPVKTDTDDFGDRLKRVSAAISGYADTMSPLAAKLSALYEEACAFRQTIDGGVYVSASDPQNPEYKAVAESSSGAIPDYSHVKATTISWKEHGPSVATNTRLLGEYADLYAKLQNAEADCANAITREVENSCVAKVTKVEAWQLRQPGVKLPWGERVEQKRDCREGVVHGIGQSGVHLYQGVVSLVAGYNPQKDIYGDGEAWGQAWVGLGTLVLGVSKIGDPIAWASRLIPDDAPAGLVAMRDMNIAGQDAVVNAAKGIVVADRWKDHPAEAFGETLGNVGTFFIPGADVASALKTGSLGARVASIGGHAADFLVPAGSLLLKGGADLALRAGEGVRIAGESIRLGSSALRGSLADALRNVGDRMPRVEVSWEPARMTPDGVVVPGHLSIDRVESAAAPDAAGGGSGGGGSAGSGSGAEHPPAASRTAVDDAPPRYGERVPGDGGHGAGPHHVVSEHKPASVHDAVQGHDDASGHGGVDANDSASNNATDPETAGTAAGESLAGDSPGHSPVMSRDDFAQLAVSDPKAAFDYASSEQLTRAKGFNMFSGDRYGTAVWGKTMEELPAGERVPTVAYTGDPPIFGNSEDLNTALRTGNGLEVYSGNIAGIDKALSAVPVPEAVIVERATDLEFINRPVFQMVGDQFTEPAYMSTSFGNPPWDATAALLHLEVPPATPAGYLEGITLSPNEHELLLGRNMTYEVDRVVLLEGKYHVFGRVLP
jgi:hypothetical protein